MLYTPSVFGESLMDDWFDGFDQMFNRMNRSMNKNLYGKRADRLMKTDVTEHDDRYEVAMDLPGFKKEDLKLELQNGYLTVSASKSLNKDEKEEKSGKLIRQERYSGSMARSFYVGEEVTEEDVQAKFENGVLKLTIPKKEEQKAVEEHKTIAIEG